MKDGNINMTKQLKTNSTRIVRIPKNKIIANVLSRMLPTLIYFTLRTLRILCSFVFQPRSKPSNLERIIGEKLNSFMGMFILYSSYVKCGCILDFRVDTFSWGRIRKITLTIYPHFPVTRLLGSFKIIIFVENVPKITFCKNLRALRRLKFFCRRQRTIRKKLTKELQMLDEKF
ncbi:CLUMA_CG020573, isoform A [Clunio marinus]|uniref:CLUMA_CG020573, isoform A n=1 Tax=Clunio marinus TaxID=568069 RepID=A0A1J1J5C9_9DIPT|nr:CLUMA_CG020573, isoform A [Clunio marinus]